MPMGGTVGGIVVLKPEGGIPDRACATGAGDVVDDTEDSSSYDCLDRNGDRGSC